MNRGVTVFLDVQDVLDVSRITLGAPPQVRDWGLLHSAVARPRASWAGADAYPDLPHKAAALLQSLTGNRALLDGSKRTGWACTMVCLDINGLRLTDPLDEDAAEELVLGAARSLLSLDETAAGLLRFVTPSA